MGDSYPRGDAPNDAEYIVGEDSPKLTEDLVLVDGSGTTVNKSTPGQISIDAAGVAPDTADYLVGTTQAGLSNEIVVGTTPTAIRSFLSAAKTGANSDITSMTAATSITNVASLGLTQVYHTGSGTLALGANTANLVEGTYTSATLPQHPGTGAGMLLVKQNRADTSVALPITTQGTDVIFYENTSTTSLGLGRGETAVFIPFSGGSFTYWVWYGSIPQIYNSTSSLGATLTVRRSDSYYYVFGNNTINMPATPDKSPNRCFIYNAGTLSSTINAAASESIYGNAGAVSSYTLLPKSGILLVSDRRGTAPNGRGWVIIGESISTLPVDRGGTGLTTSGSDSTKVLTSNGSGGFVMSTPAGFTTGEYIIDSDIDLDDYSGYNLNVITVVASANPVEITMQLADNNTEYLIRRVDGENDITITGNGVDAYWAYEYDPVFVDNRIGGHVHIKGIYTDYGDLTDYQEFYLLSRTKKRSGSSSASSVDPFNITWTDETHFLLDPAGTGGAQSVVLPEVPANGSDFDGQEITLKQTTTGVITVTVDNSGTIDGSADDTLNTVNMSRTYIVHGGDWYIK